MFLKRIVLHGFKSFADRTEFEFGPGFTGIVGPNGCGKSNVVDAVRWVLGEQSARSLRGQKMQDVIFAGSRTRKPAAFAEVQLHFDNSSGRLACDESEVIVSRTLYAGGESEYRLNGNLVRLKDIRDLLLDTGVGVEAYSIIEQGRVDALLAANPLERREIFDEAAGISRYKVRRAEAQRKLERTRNNLLRLSDVLDELERRLRSVKLAAGKARSFQEYDARLRELKASFALAEYHSLEEARRSLRARVDALTDLLAAQHAGLARCEADAAEREGALQSADETIRTAEADLAARHSEGSALAERLSQIRRRIEELTAAREQRLTAATSAATRAGELERRIAGEEQSLESLRETAQREAELAAELEAARARAEADCQAAQQELEEARRTGFEAVRQATLLANERANVQRHLERLEHELAGLELRCRELEEHGAILRRKRAESELATSDLSRRADECAAQIRQLDQRIATLETEAEELARQIAAQKEARSAIGSRLALLEDLERRQEGLDQACRAVLSWCEEAPGAGSVVGLVADLLRIDDPRVSALQAVLSRFEQHIVIRDTYAFLAESRRRTLPGPVHVLALDRLPPRSPGLPYQDSAPGIGRVLDWIRCDEEFRPLGEHLLGRVFVVDHVERALALASAAPPGYEFVSLDGHVVSSDGSVVAGAHLVPGGLISRKTEGRNLRRELDELETGLERLLRQAGQMREALADERLRREALLTELAALQKSCAEARTDLLRLEDESARREREATRLAADSQALFSSLASARAQLAAAIAEQQRAERQKEEHEQQVETLARRVRELEELRETRVQELTEALVRAGRAAERRAAAEHGLRELRGRLGALEQERERAEAEASEAGNRIESAQQELSECSERQAALSLECREREARILTLRETRQLLRRRLETIQTSVRELHTAIEQTRGVLSQRQVLLRELEVRQESLAARVREELSLDLAALLREHRPVEQDWEAVREEIESLRVRIARLGHVNLDALAELEELTPRYENLVEQRQDLLDSIERLERLISELDEESRSRFAASFEQIRSHFQELFRKLFGGGKADIILEDVDNPLECGIEIIARPPGKEPQSISLLSGGEKTMTTVALLLAVFQSKPSPFALLDEVDAALDEANIDRFNNVLEEFLAHSQFVVITHNKRTMQRCDVLYGVTMEEPGVSKRVGVRLDECVSTPALA